MLPAQNLSRPVVPVAAANDWGRSMYSTIRVRPATDNTTPIRSSAVRRDTTRVVICEPLR